jgi:mannosyltransferase OCH1-like enzyme
MGMDAASQKIPKIIHYIWVGGKPLPAIVQRCIASWKKIAPEYAVRFWNEDNSPIDHPYVRAMYAQKKWAFVSDYIRFWALEREGGIYLDTDMELLQPIDRFLSDVVFVGDTKSGDTSCGIIGAIPHHPFIQKTLDFYDTDTEFSTTHTSPRVIQKILRNHAFTDVRVYEPAYFYPCDDGERCSPEALANAYATHHWAESWVPFARTRKIARRLGIMPVIKKIVGK